MVSASRAFVEDDRWGPTGGIGALALLGKGFPVYIDSRAIGEKEILVSAGQRGFDVRIGVEDLVALTGAHPVVSGGS